MARPNAMNSVLLGSASLPLYRLAIYRRFLIDVVDSWHAGALERIERLLLTSTLIIKQGLHSRKVPGHYHVPAAHLMGKLCQEIGLLEPTAPSGEHRIDIELSGVIIQNDFTRLRRQSLYFRPKVYAFILV
jgi:hypothetical protein